MTRGLHPGKVAKGALAGLLGGLAASFAMNQFMNGVALATQGRTPTGADPPRTKERIAARKKRFQQMADPTGEVCEALAHKLFPRSLSPRERDLAGPLWHYVLGAMMGVVYGCLAEILPSISAARGTAYGLSLWLGGDELAVPALGLTRKPWQQPADAHAAMFASHIVYGVALETVRRSVRNAIA